MRRLALVFQFQHLMEMIVKKRTQNYERFLWRCKRIVGFFSALQVHYIEWSYFSDFRSHYTQNNMLIQVAHERKENNHIVKMQMLSVGRKMRQHGSKM